MIRRGVFVLVTFALFATAGGAAVAWASGWKLSIVQTGSMAPAVPRNSLALVVPGDPRDAHIGDVIAFHDPADARVVIMHRVVRVIDNQAGGRAYETRGDANATPDPVYVPSREVVGKLGWHAAHLGGVAAQVKPPWSYLVLVGTPLLLLAVSEIRTWRAARHARRFAPRPSIP